MQAGNSERPRISRQHLTQDWSVRADEPRQTRRSKGQRNRRLNCTVGRREWKSQTIQQSDPEAARFVESPQDRVRNQPSGGHDARSYDAIASAMLQERVMRSARYSPQEPRAEPFARARSREKGLDRETDGS